MFDSFVDPSFKTTGEFTLDKNFLDRMEDQMIVRLANKEDILDTQDEDFEKNYPFTPAISNQSRLICKMNKQEPIYVRYQEYLDEKNKKLEEIREEKKRREKAEAKTQMATNRKRRRSKDDIDRDFYKDNKDWLEKKNRKIKNQVAQKLRREVTDPNLTFKPRINSRSKDILRDKNFEERQRIYRKKKDKKQLKTIMALPTYKFKPNLNKNSLAMASKSRDGSLRRTSSAIMGKNRKTSKKTNKLDVKFSGQKTVKVSKNELSKDEKDTLRPSNLESPRVQAFDDDINPYEIYHFNKALTQKKERGPMFSSIRGTSNPPSTIRENATFYNSATREEAPREPLAEKITIEDMNVSFSNKNSKSSIILPRSSAPIDQRFGSPPKKLTKRRKKKRTTKKRTRSPVKTAKKKRKKTKKKKRLSVVGSKGFSRVREEEGKKKKKKKKKTKRKIGNSYSSKTPMRLRSTPEEI